MWIVAGHALAPRQQELRATVDIANDGRAIAAGAVFARRFPKRPAGRLIEGNDVGIAVVVAVDDQSVFKHHGRAAKTVHARKDARALFPVFVALEIISRREHFALIEKTDVNEL